MLSPATTSSAPGRAGGLLAPLVLLLTLTVHPAPAQPTPAGLTPSAQATAALRVLFVRGGDRTAGFKSAGTDAERTEHLSDVYDMTSGVRNHGWGELRLALEAEGFVVEQVTEGAETVSGPADGISVDFTNVDLDAYAVLVLGSNNAVYDDASIDAVEAYVRGGGGILFISDADFGSDWADAPNSDQQFLDRFGLVMNQDHGTYTVARGQGDFRAPGHPIFDGVMGFSGEGVSPVNLGTPAEGVVPAVLAGAEVQTRVNEPPFDDKQQGEIRPVTADDAALLVAEVDAGRLAGHFDRNTFFNEGGAGSDLTRNDNERYALNLFGWLAGLTSVPLPVELAAFEAVADGAGVVLTWTTVSEQGNAGFSVEHRPPTEAWRGVAFAEGLGTTSRAQRYVHRLDGLAPGTHGVRLRQLDRDGTARLLAEAEVTVHAAAVVLEPPQPNPVRHQARVGYALPAPAAVRLEVYDLMGRRVATLAEAPHAAGRHEAVFDAAGLASGLYLVRLTAGTTSQTTTLLLQR